MKSSTKNEKKEQIKAFGYLKKQFNPQGWFPYVEKGGPSTESTAWCAIALKNDSEISFQVSKYLITTQNKDGGWSSCHNCGPSDWTSSVALLALVLSNKEKSNSNDSKWLKSVHEASNFLLDNRFEVLQSFWRMLFIITQGPEYDYARGWPWTPDTFNWVEPTCFAIYALSEASLVIDDKKINHRIDRALKHATEYLLEFSCKNGGWNFGNNIVFGYTVPPMLINTCQALIALHKYPKKEQIKSALNYLEQEEQKENSVLSLAWSSLARHYLKLDTKTRLEALVKQQQEDGGFLNNSMITALASIALNCSDTDSPLIKSTLNKS
jgi:hypothetical protein